MTAPLILVSNAVRGAANAPDSPRLDYVEVARALGGDLLGTDLSDGGWYRAVRNVEKRLKLDVVEALAAHRRAPGHSAVLSLSEKLAIPLAVLFQLTRRRTPHLVVAHKLSSGLKTRLFKLWGLQKTFAHVICVSRTQADYAVNTLGVPRERVAFVYDKVDHRYFAPQTVDTEDFILAVGQEQRDYPTLLEAAVGAGLKLVVVALSPWSTSQVQVHDLSGVRVLSRIPYSELRDLYARARLVVVPLHDVDYAAGVNGLLEGMAMGKACIVSRTPGIADYVTEGETAVYAPPADPDALREAIRALWDNPGERARLGANARQAVEQQMNLDHYVAALAGLVGEVSA